MRPFLTSTGQWINLDTVVAIGPLRVGFGNCSIGSCTIYAQLSTFNAELGLEDWGRSLQLPYSERAAIAQKEYDELLAAWKGE